MALKMLEAHVPTELATDAEAVLQALDQTWTEAGGRFGSVVHAVVGSEKSGGAVDALHEALSDRGRLMVLVGPLDAVIPRPAATHHPARAERIRSAAVSREEVYANIADGAKLTATT